MKIVDKMNDNIKKNKIFYSFEFFPPKTDEGVDNLFDRQERMSALGPTFCDITWGAGGSTADLTLKIAASMQNTVCVETMMHLTCTNINKDELSDALRQARSAGIQNILALRGDPPKGQGQFEAIEGGFSCALDLVKFIREEHGDWFGIAVAGYPEAHPDRITDDKEEMQKNYWSDIHYLKAKVDAGADFIVTQLFYDVDTYVQFQKDCRSVGIQCPIIPGIMPIQSYGGFKRMTGFCKTRVPAEIEMALEVVKDNEEEVKRVGIELGVKMCQQLLDAGVPGLHLYTLNLEKAAVTILEKLNLLHGRVEQRMPWRAVPLPKRSSEGVRPIFWSNRPKSYISRTKDWESFPNGRWGDAQSPAYGTLSDYQFMRRHSTSKARLEKARKQWGFELKNTDDVISVFERYVAGEIDALPWNEMDALHSETSLIKSDLTRLNHAGYLTINSQPAVNGLPSVDPNHGWGGPGGYVYQKAYVEFFCAPEKFQRLRERLGGKPSITYLAVDSTGEIQSSEPNMEANAVTWGVFPGKQIVQPTVVDPASFQVWKDEAFDLWTQEWGSLYEEGSTSRQVLESIAKSWYLVSVVENDYIGGNLFSIFDEPAANGASRH